jgi:hypothetical protein
MMNLPIRSLVFSLAAVALAGRPGVAQQFKEVVGGIPGPVVWSEGVEVFDADGDGWVDVLYVNGVGFSSAGGSVPPTLLMNHTPPGGTITLLDETATRLPLGFSVQGKGATVCDVDGDGDIDIIIATAFNNQPRILINDGTGHFTDETALRFPAVLLNSFGVGFGDVDGDGDIDLVFADAGPSAFGSPGGKARLFLNDGTGHFTDSPSFINAANKVGAQNAQMVDVNNDFALDIVVDGKSNGQQLYINDGTGHFTLQAATLPTGSAQTYATDWADLDNDNDIDGFYISLSGFSEGTAQNNLIPGGTLTFAGSTATLGGANGDDDNDVVFLDANDDGLLDAIVGSLGASQEKLYLNGGTFAPGSFVFQATGFTAESDSTLDLAIGDFDNDGAYDVVTAQGESGLWLNRVYRNRGAVDTLPPRIGRIEATPSLVPLSVIQSGGLARRAWIQDATYKRGQTFVSAGLDVTAVKDADVQVFSTPMRTVGGGMHRGVIQPAASPTGTVGMDVTFTVHAADPSANASDSALVMFKICGAESYGTAAPNSAGPGAFIAPVNDPSVAANNFSVTITGLPPSVAGVLFYGTQRLASPLPFGNGQRWVGGPLQRLPLVNANGSGVATVVLDFTTTPLSNLAPGDTRYFEFQYRDQAAGGANFNGSNALEVVLCD